MISRDFLWRDPHHRGARRSGLGAHPILAVSTAFVLLSMGYLWASSPGQHATIASPVPQVPFGIPDERVSPPVKQEARASAPTPEAVATVPVPPERPIESESVALAAPAPAAIPDPAATPDPADGPGDGPGDDETGAVALPTEEPAEPASAVIPLPAPAAQAREESAEMPATSAVPPKASEQAIEASVLPAQEQKVAAPTQPAETPVQPTKQEKVAAPSQEAQVLPVPVKPKQAKKRRPAATDVPPEVMAAVRRLSRERAQRRNVREQMARRQWEYDYGAPVSALPQLDYRVFRGRGGAGPYYYDGEEWM